MAAYTRPARTGHKEGAEAPAGIQAARAALEAAVKGAAWNTADGSQLLLRLLCATPFSAHDVRQPLPMSQNPRGTAADPPGVQPMPLCHAFGSLLDATVLPRYRMRPYANAWLTWSCQRLTELAGAFACAGSAPKRYMPCTECGNAGTDTVPVQGDHAGIELDECDDSHDDTVSSDDGSLDSVEIPRNPHTHVREATLLDRSATTPARH